MLRGETPYQDRDDGIDKHDLRPRIVIGGWGNFPGFLGVEADENRVFVQVRSFL
jgi:hypothetical protein